MNQHESAGSVNPSQFGPQATSQPFTGYPTMPPVSTFIPGSYLNPYANYINPYANHINPYANHGHYYPNWAGYPSPHNYPVTVPPFSGCHSHHYPTWSGYNYPHNYPAIANLYSGCHPQYPTSICDRGYPSFCNPCTSHIPHIPMPQPTCPPKEQNCSCSHKENKCGGSNFFNFDHYYQLLISNQALISQIKYLEFEIAKHIEMIKSLKEEIKELEKKLEKKDEKIKELEDKLEKSEKEVDELKDKIKSLEEELAKERSKKKDCSAVEKLLDKERKTSGELAQKLDDLKTEVTNASSPDDLAQIKNKISAKTFDSPTKY